MSSRSVRIAALTVFFMLLGLVVRGTGVFFLSAAVPLMIFVIGIFYIGGGSNRLMIWLAATLVISDLLSGNILGASIVAIAISGLVVFAVNYYLHFIPSDAPVAFAVTVGLLVLLVAMPVLSALDLIAYRVNLSSIILNLVVFGPISMGSAYLLRTKESVFA